MKTVKCFSVLASLLIVSGAYAQTAYDAAKLSDSDLNGTARFIGMGGAMGALGGDLSTMTTNPAGIGIFRKSEMNASIGVQGTTMGGQKKTIPTFDNIGFVVSTKYGEQTSLKFINFGFNYHRRKDFNANLEVNYDSNDLLVPGPDGGRMSQTLIMKGNLGSATWDDAKDFFVNFPDNVSPSNPLYNAPSIAQLGVLGLLTFNSSALLYTPAQSARYYSEQTGGVDEFDFNMALNVNDQFYFGATVGAHSVNYNLISAYSEIPYNMPDGGYTLSNWQKTTGVGFDMKLGMIIRPIETSPFRIGLAIHTPTWYNLTNTYNVNLYSSFVTADEAQALIPGSTPGELNNINLSEVSWDYQMITPWKFDVSLGHTVGNVLALGAEYEYMDYSSCKFADERGDEEVYYIEKNSIKENLKGVHTLRLGLEAKVAPDFSLRAGYNYSSAMMKKTAYNSVDSYNYTETAFLNSLDRNVLSFGLGYRGRNLYADFAYQYSTNKYDFYAFDDINLKAKSVSLDRNKAVLTVGYRF